MPLFGEEENGSGITQLKKRKRKKKIGPKWLSMESAQDQKNHSSLSDAHLNFPWMFDARSDWSLTWGNLPGGG